MVHVCTEQSRAGQPGQGSQPPWVWWDQPLMILQPEFPVKGLKEKFNAVAFYLPLQLMSTQSKQGSSNMPVRFRYTRLSS